MTEEHIKEKAKDFVSKRAGGTSKEMDYYADILAEFVNEITKELQNENAELEEKLEQAEKDLADYQFNYPTIKELEKENAELKEKYDTCLRENTGLKIHSAYVEKKLTKAKELIEDMYDAIPSSHSDYYKDVMERARQFLKE